MKTNTKPNQTNYPINHLSDHISSYNWKTMPPTQKLGQFYKVESSKPRSCSEPNQAPKPHPYNQTHPFTSNSSQNHPTSTLAQLKKASHYQPKTLISKSWHSLCQFAN